MRCGPCVIVGELEFSFGVGLGAGGLFHAVGQLDENDIVAGRRLVGGAIVHRAGEGFGGGERAEESKSKCSAADLTGEVQTLAPFLSRSEALRRRRHCSRRAISARIAAASSSSEVFIAW